MSVYLYDKAFVEYLREATKNKIQIVPPDNVFRTMALLDSDKITFPMISLQRPSWKILRDIQSFSLINEGRIVRIEENDSGDPEKVVRANVVPIQIDYIIDVWTTDREMNDNIIRELILWLMTNPTIEVTIPYDLDIVQNFNIVLNTDVQDNSDIVAQNERGRYFRQSISAFTEDCYLWKSSTRLPTRVYPEVIFNDNGNEINEEDGTYDILEKG